jgi:hypothetical protein
LWGVHRYARTNSMLSHATTLAEWRQLLSA